MSHSSQVEQVDRQSEPDALGEPTDTASVKHDEVEPAEGNDEGKEENEDKDEKLSGR
jgi:hypothetical protein